MGSHMGGSRRALQRDGCSLGDMASREGCKDARNEQRGGEPLQRLAVILAVGVPVCAHTVLLKTGAHCIGMRSNTVLVRQTDDAASRQAAGTSKKERLTVLVALHTSQHAREELGQEVRLHTSRTRSFKQSMQHSNQ